jgi:hypothetical protein
MEDSRRVVKFEGEQENDELPKSMTETCLRSGLMKKYMGSVYIK